MAYQTSLAQTAANDDALFDAINTFLTSTIGGWTLHDNQESGSSYNIYKCVGEDGTEKGYVKIDKGTANLIKINVYGGWDASAHTGTRDSTVISITTNNVNPFTYWLYGNKDSVSFITKISNIYRWGMFGIPTRTWSSNKATSVNAEIAGAAQVIEVGAGEEDYFTANQYYLICDETNMERIQITAIDTGAHTVTATLANAYTAGALIGEDPQPFFNGHVGTRAAYFGNHYNGYASAGGHTSVRQGAISGNGITACTSMERYASRFILVPILDVHESTSYNEVRGIVKNAYHIYPATGMSSEDTITISSVVYDVFNFDAGNYDSANWVAFPRTV